MRHLKLSLALTGIAFLLGGCGGGGGSGSSSSSSGGMSQNLAPTANAGPPQSVTSGATVTLNGTGSSDPDGTVASYAWTQSSGNIAIALSSDTAAQPTFVAPNVATTQVVVFSLTVRDNKNAVSTAASTVAITINPAVVVGNVNVTGRVRFERVRFLATGRRGLDYANPVLQPARGIVVRAVTASTTAPISAGVTDANGDFSLSVPGNADIRIQVESRLLKTGAGPTWDIRVQDGTTGSNPVLFNGEAFNSGPGATQNLDLPTGINASGTGTGIRLSGPYAILDTIYTAIQGVLAAAPSTAFPELIVDWGSQSEGTFFTSSPVQHIALLSDLTEDTDEFDQHVIAHEFGHYIEHNFSRADNIGGSHSLGNRLDPRVAFGEGFGYAFAAMMLNNTDARDSFFGDVTPNDGLDNPVQASSGFDVELNPTGTSGCWCSESSVYSILYDLYDSAADSNDAVALGFQPLWNVLTSEQRTTPAFTTIFSFITALKAAQPGSAAAINTLVAAQNIDTATIDAFATGETHFPAEVAQGAALPLYSTATLGGAALVLSSTNSAGTYNRLGNHRFVRFNVHTQRSVTITLGTSNATDNDPDFRIFRAGGFIDSGEGPPPGPETGTFNLAAGNYLLDIYDCANGCSTEQGTAGNYNLTVTIN